MRVFPNHMETHLDAISNNPNMLIKHYSNYKNCMDIRHVSSRLGEEALMDLVCWYHTLIFKHKQMEASIT